MHGGILALASEPPMGGIPDGKYAEAEIKPGPLTNHPQAASRWRMTRSPVRKAASSGVSAKAAA